MQSLSLLLATCLSSTLAFAYSDSEYHDHKETKAAGKADVSSMSPEELNDYIFPGVYKAPKGIHLSVSADYLYWRSSVENFPYIVTGDAITPFQYQRTEVALNGTYGSGFRVGLSYQMPETAWGANINWTSHDNSSTNVTTNKVGEKNLFQYWITEVDEESNVITRATGKSSIDLDVLDFTLCRPFKVSKWMQLTPYFGLRQLWLDINQTVSIIDETNETTKTVIKNDISRFGIVAGLETSFNIGWGLGIYGQAGFSEVYGTNETDYRSTQTRLTDSDRAKVQTNGFRNITPLFDLACGFSWNRNFADEAFGLGLKIGYEMHVFPDQFYVGREAVVESSVSDSIFPFYYNTTFQGLTVSVELSF